jgi:hypothetical protein
VAAVLAGGALLLAGCDSGTTAAPVADPGGSTTARVTQVEQQLDDIQRDLDSDG